MSVSGNKPMVDFVLNSEQETKRTFCESDSDGNQCDWGFNPEAPEPWRWSPPQEQMFRGAEPPKMNFFF